MASLASSYQRTRLDPLVHTSGAVMLSWSALKQLLIENLAFTDSSESARWANETCQIDVEDKGEAGPCRQTFRSATVQVFRSDNKANYSRSKMPHGPLNLCKQSRMPDIIRSNDKDPRTLHP